MILIPDKREDASNKNLYYLNPPFKTPSMDALSKFVLLMILLCAGCHNKPAAVENIKFDRAKWYEKEHNKYVHRKYMINDLLKNYRWSGVPKDSVTNMLGQPDNTEEGHLVYTYESRPILGGLGTKIEAIVFELNADSTVKVARENDAGWD
jgi:hypothetical protein